MIAGTSWWLNYGDRTQWNQLLSSLGREHNDIYFSPDYVHLYEGPGAAAQCFAYRRGDSLFLYPFLLQDILHKPGYHDMQTPYGYGGPLANTLDEQFLGEAYDAFTVEARARRVVAQLVKFHPLLNNQSLFAHAPGMTMFRMCSTVSVDLSEEEQVLWTKRYTHANRKNINKARRNGVTVEFGASDQLWSSFRSLYEKTMEANRADRSYYFPESYHRSIREELAGRYVLAAALKEGTPLSVLLVLLGGAFAHCHLLGTDREAMKLGVNNQLHHEVVLWCKQRGCQKLHIGGGRTDAPDDSLLRFKMSFSDVTESAFVGESVLDEDVYNELCSDWRRRNPDHPKSNRLLKYRF